MPILLAGKQSGRVTLEISLAYEVAHTYTSQPSNPTPRCLSKRNKTYVHIKTSMQYYLIYSYLSQLEMAQCLPAGEWKETSSGVSLPLELVLSNRKESTTDM